MAVTRHSNDQGESTSSATVSQGRAHAALGAPSTTADALLGLQRLAGNQAVVRLVGGGVAPNVGFSSPVMVQRVIPGGNHNGQIVEQLQGDPPETYSIVESYPPDPKVGRKFWKYDVVQQGVPPDEAKRVFILGNAMNYGLQGDLAARSELEKSAKQTAPSAEASVKATVLPVLGESRARYIDPTSRESPGQSWDRYREATNQQPAVPGPDSAIPWLAVGDLYAGVTITGNGSWMEIVNDRVNGRSGKKTTDFTVFTGMHGNTGGQFVDDSGLIREQYKDSKHSVEDRAVAEYLQRELRCNIRIVDVFEEPNMRHPEQMKKRAKEEIAQGRVVILAWCYSMEAFKSVPDRGSDQQPIVKDMPSEKAYVKERTEKPYSDIVPDAFGSDLSGYFRPDMLPAPGERVTNGLVRQLVLAKRDDLLQQLHDSNDYPLEQFEPGAMRAVQQALGHD